MTRASLATKTKAEKIPTLMKATFTYLVGATYLAGVAVFGLLPWHWSYRGRALPAPEELAALTDLSDEALDALDRQRRRGRSPLVAPPSLRRLARVAVS